MPSRTVTVGNPPGLDSIASAVIARAAAEFDDEILLSGAGKEPIDAKSGLLIMTQLAEYGMSVTVESTSQEAVDVIAALVTRDLTGEWPRGLPALPPAPA